MRDLTEYLRRAAVLTCAARDDLRAASAEHAARGTVAALHLAQLAAGVAKAARHLPRTVVTPATPDPWVVAAGGLHEAVAKTADGLLGLWEAAEASRTILAVPPDAVVAPGDYGLFGFEPESDAFDGWTAPTDGARLDALSLSIGSAAWRRRAAIRASCALWYEEHQAAVDASGAAVLRDVLADMHGVIVQIRAAMADVPASTVAAARAKARTAARALVELGDDPGALSGIARDYAALQDSCPSTRLAWCAVGDLLAAAERG